MGKEILFALVLCFISIPIAPNLAKQILPEILLPVLGISVSVFTAFRNTQAYNRWWEARTLWGGLVNGSRNWRNGLLDKVRKEDFLLGASLNNDLQVGDATHGKNIITQPQRTYYPKDEKKFLHILNR